MNPLWSRRGGSPWVLGAAASVALHAGVVGLALMHSDANPSGMISAGSEGDEMISIEAVAATFIELEPMIEPPAPPMELPPEPPPVDMPRIDLPTLAQVPEDAPVLNVPPPRLEPQVAELPKPPVMEVPPPPPEPPKAEPKPEPKPKPKPRKAEPKREKPEGKPAAQKSAGIAAQRAAGSGGGAQAGEGGRADVATLSPGKARDLRAQWGAAIRSRIERRKVYPAAAGRTRGEATVRLTVTKGGQLAGVSLAKSSGNGALDQAAVQAVSRAGKFPAAPKGLDEASYSFSLTIQFSR